MVGAIEAVIGAADAVGVNVGCGVGRGDCVGCHVRGESLAQIWCVVLCVFEYLSSHSKRLSIPLMLQHTWFHRQNGYHESEAVPAKPALSVIAGRSAVCPSSASNSSQSSRDDGAPPCQTLLSTFELLDMKCSTRSWLLVTQ